MSSVWDRRRLGAITAPPPSNPSPSFSEASTEIPQWNRPGHVRASSSDDISTHMMDDILSPDSGMSDRFFTDDEHAAAEEQLSESFSQSEASADSIIQRVEEEIAAARLAAANANKHKVGATGRVTGMDREYSHPATEEEFKRPYSESPNQRRPTNDVGEEFEKEFSSVYNRDDQISLFSGDDFSSFDYFAEEFKDCGESVSTQQIHNQHVASPVSPSGSSAFGGRTYQSGTTAGRTPLSPATTVETVPASNGVLHSTSWDSFDTHQRDQDSHHELNRDSLGALTSASQSQNDEKEDDRASVQDASSIGTSVGGTRNAQRARAILDTLKERRETFKSVFLTSNTLSKSPSPPLETKVPLAPIAEPPTIRDDIADEKKEDEPSPAPWNAPVIEQLPVPITKKVKKKESEPESNLETKAEAKVKEVEENINRKSRRIRFRDTFPVIKHPPRPRVAEDIIAEHALGTPDFPIRWVRPKSDLKQLIVAAMGDSLARRSNACGALKVLTGQKKNQLTLARTDSFLEALVFAATQEIPSTDEHELALTARTRAIACLKNVCEPKDNRIHILMHAGNMECLAQVIREDHGEARVLACMALAFLAKTPECREIMASMDGLLALLAGVLKGESNVPANEMEGGMSQESDLSHSGDDGSDEKSLSGSESEYSGQSQDRSQHSGEDSRSGGSNGESTSSDNSTLSETSTHRPDSLNDDKKRKNQKLSKSPQQKLAEKNAEFLPKARSNACAVVLHLSKHCAVLSQLCSDSNLVEALVTVASEAENPLHSKCLEIICNLTRFPSNTSFMTRYMGLTEVLVVAADSPIESDRIFALRSLQNMSADSSSKALLATETILSKITVCALRNSPEEKEASVAFLYNVSTEPGAVVAITNTKNVVATLVHLAHHPDSSSDIRLMACDALATISLWLQTLAGTGRVPKDLPNVPLPSHKTTGWNRWD